MFVLILTLITAVSATVPCRALTKFPSKENTKFVYNPMAQTLLLPSCGCAAGDQMWYEVSQMVLSRRKCWLT